MNFNVSLVISNQDLSPLWKKVESYLNVREKVYKITSVKDKKILLEKGKIRNSFVSILLKIVSYATVVFPLLALIIRNAYRRQYSYEILKKAKRTPLVDISKSLEKGINRFKKDYEEKYVNSEDVIFKLYEQNLDEKKLDISQIEKQLRGFLQKRTYARSKEKVIEIVYNALQDLLKKPSLESVSIAKLIYKKISEFLRKNTDKEHLENYSRHLNEMFDGQTQNPHCYLMSKLRDLSNESSSDRNHYVDLAFLLRHLRKQIKLTKSEKLQAKINIISEEQNLSEDSVKNALNYLGITWLHGTKAFTIYSACEKTDGDLLPTGELKKRKVLSLSGEQFTGATATGINQNFLSGVNLADAACSIGYSKDFEFQKEKEIEIYQRLLTQKFDESENLSDDGSFSRRIESLKRLQYSNPEILEKDKDLLKQKIEEIYRGLQKHFLSVRKPSEVFHWHDKYGSSSSTYSFLKALEEFEDILNAHQKESKVTIDEESLQAQQKLATIPVVVASTTNYGIPASPIVYFNPEEIYPSKVSLAKNIQVLFTEENDIDTVEGLIKQYGLEESIKVEPMSILQTASKLDRALGSYFYDFFNIKKWQNN